MYVYSWVICKLLTVLKKSHSSVFPLGSVIVRSLTPLWLLKEYNLVFAKDTFSHKLTFSYNYDTFTKKISILLGLKYIF